MFECMLDDPAEARMGDATMLMCEDDMMGLDEERLDNCGIYVTGNLHGVFYRMTSVACVELEQTDVFKSPSSAPLIIEISSRCQYSIQSPKYRRSKYQKGQIQYIYSVQPSPYT